MNSFTMSYNIKVENAYSVSHLLSLSSRDPLNLLSLKGITWSHVVVNVQQLW